VTTILVPVSAHALPHRSPAELLALGRRSIADAEAVDAPSIRYAFAHLAALRAAAAVIAVRARPTPRGRRRITSVWVLLTIIAPELGEWAAYFAAAACDRSAVEAGVATPTAEDADRLTEHVRRWIEVVEGAIGHGR
jgi:hypothetical protein